MKRIALDNFTRLQAVDKTSILFANIVICSFRGVGAGIHVFSGEIVTGDSWQKVYNRFFIAALCGVSLRLGQLRINNISKSVTD